LCRKKLINFSGRMELELTENELIRDRERGMLCFQDREEIPGRRNCRASRENRQ
jgi:hypothetical protein